MVSVADMRVNYSEVGLDDETIKAADPMDLFAAWLKEAAAADEPEPNAMCLATVSPAGQPSARHVLLKGFDARGFVWYTNYQSRKAGDLEHNPAVALSFWWPSLFRCIRIEGDAHRISDDESDAYFHSRPAQSRLGAWVSDQSRPIATRKDLDAQQAELQREYFGKDGALVKDISRPPHWGGYRAVPRRIEFWKGRASRLHDRFVFEREDADHPWSVHRLQP
jgi:pyridoxamine 5'-phosphate oxidase